MTDEQITKEQLAEMPPEALLVAKRSGKLEHLGFGPSRKDRRRIEAEAVIAAAEEAASNG